MFKRRSKRSLLAEVEILHALWQSAEQDLDDAESEIDAVFTMCSALTAELEAIEHDLAEVTKQRDEALRQLDYLEHS